MEYFLILLIAVSPNFIASSPDSDNYVIAKAIKEAFDEPQEMFSATNYEETSALEDNVTPKVQTPLGIISGVGLNEAHGFYKIPYGNVPTRFGYSVPVDSYPDGKLNATDIGEYFCFQRNPNCPDEESCQEKMGEDCLVLNVHSSRNVDLSDPNAPPSDRLPVIIWIHGGAFQAGSGTSARFDGRYLSNKTNSVIVSINYRLGTFGFLAFEENDTTVCNQGFGDQQLAMRWVQDHIELFGGDKNKVTITGTSAGAQSVMFHLMSPNSTDLFHRAVMQSQPTVFQYPDVKRALLSTTNLLENAKCIEEGIQCLRNLDAGTLVKRGLQVQFQNVISGDLYGLIEPFGMVLDGSEFKENPIQFVQNGGFSGDKDIIIGTTTDEMIYIPAYIPDRLNITQERYENLLVFLLGENVGKAIAAKYDEMADGTDKDYQYILGDIATDGFFICPTRALSRLASKSTDVYLYSFAHGMNDSSCLDSFSPNEICGHAFHSSESTFIFRADPLISYNFSESDVITADQFSYYWGNFALTGDPSLGDETSVEEFSSWPRYVQGTTKKQLSSVISKLSADRPLWPNRVILPPEGAVEFNYKEDICDFWDDLKYYVDLDSEVTTPATDDVTTPATDEVTNDVTTPATDGVTTRNHVTNNVTLLVTTTGNLREEDTTTDNAGVNKSSFGLLVLALCFNILLLS